MSLSINKLTLDAQIEERLVEDSNWMKLCEAKEGIMCADKEIVALKAIYNRTSAIESKLKTLLRDLSTLKQTKLWAEINVERVRSLLRHQILFEADVVGSTLSSSGKKQFLDLALRDDIIFDTCIIDEAAQATEPSCLIPLRLGCRRLVLVGDPRQLPATIHSKESTDAGLGTSLFERLERAEHEVVMLTIQYRMHPGKMEDG
jgi:senataxin